MTKQEIIDELYIVCEVYLCGYSREKLESMNKKELKVWLERLQE